MTSRDGLTEDQAALCSARDILLPGIYALTQKQGADFESDLFINFRQLKLTMKVYRFSTKKTASDEISLNDIKNGTFVLGPRLLKLFEGLADKAA